jgi:hypothetical protein
VHLDNARPHNSRKSSEPLVEFHARALPHLAYSPERAPPDFFLFGIVKTKSQNHKIHSREDLDWAIRAISAPNVLPRAIQNK